MHRKTEVVSMGGNTFSQQSICHMKLNKITEIYLPYMKELLHLLVWMCDWCVLVNLCTLNTQAVCPPDRRVWVSLCKLQISSDPDERLSFLSFRNDSHKFCNARFNGGHSLEDLLLQTGHSWVFLVLQNCWRHSLQKLWLHDKITGVLKISQHTGQL